MAAWGGDRCNGSLNRREFLHGTLCKLKAKRSVGRVCTLTALGSQSCTPGGQPSTFTPTVTVTELMTHANSGIQSTPVLGVKYNKHVIVIPLLLVVTRQVTHYLSQYHHLNGLVTHHFWLTWRQTLLFPNLWSEVTRPPSGMKKFRWREFVFHELITLICRNW